MAQQLGTSNNGDLLNGQEKQPDKWTRDERKRRRNKGEAYLNRSGEMVPEKKLGPPCRCPMKCREKLHNTEQDVFNAFWRIGIYEKQNTYLSGLMKVVPPKRRRYAEVRPPNVASRRNISVQYFIKVREVDVQVCKREFCSVHGLCNKRVMTVRKKLCTGNLELLSDQRGKHGNRKNRLSMESVQTVEDHIRSITNFDEMNIDDVTLKFKRSYYFDYQQWCTKRNFQQVSEKKYRQIFHDVSFCPLTLSCLRNTLLNEIILCFQVTGKIDSFHQVYCEGNEIEQFMLRETDEGEVSDESISEEEEESNSDKEEMLVEVDPVSNTLTLLKIFQLQYYFEKCSSLIVSVQV